MLYLNFYFFRICRQCRNKRYQEPNAHSDKKMDNTRSNPMYDPNDLQENQESTVNVHIQPTRHIIQPYIVLLLTMIIYKAKRTKGTIIQMEGIQTTRIKGIRLPTIIYKAKMACKISKLKRWKQMSIHI